MLDVQLSAPQGEQFLPDDVLFQITRLAAQSSLRNCANLCLVSRSVNSWAKPFLFERIDGLTNTSAKIFHSEMVKKPARFLTQDVHVKALSFTEPIPLPIAKAVLAGCSHRLLSFSAKSTVYEATALESPAKYFPYIRSRHLRRLCLILSDWDGPGSLPMSSLIRKWTSVTVNWIDQGDFNPNLLASVTHLITYAPMWWQPNSGPGGFDNLTHLAMSSYNMTEVGPVLTRCPRLRYVAWLHDDVPTLDVAKRAWTTQRSGKLPTGRWVVLNKRGISDATLLDSGEQAAFWRKVEKLVDAGFWNEEGERFVEDGSLTGRWNFRPEGYLLYNS